MRSSPAAQRADWWVYWSAPRDDAQEIRNASSGITAEAPYIGRELNADGAIGHETVGSAELSTTKDVAFVMIFTAGLSFEMLNENERNAGMSSLRGGSDSFAFHHFGVRGI